MSAADFSAVAADLAPARDGFAAARVAAVRYRDEARGSLDELREPDQRAAMERVVAHLDERVAICDELLAKVDSIPETLREIQALADRLTHLAAVGLGVTDG